MIDLRHEQIDEKEAGREMNALVAELVMKDMIYEFPPGIINNVRQYSTDIAAAWKVDKEDWYWSFFETPNYLQITLYPSRELWDKRPWDCHPYPEGVVHVDVLWKDYKTKAQAYAVGRCKAALKAVIG